MLVTDNIPLTDPPESPVVVIWARHSRQQVCFLPIHFVTEALVGDDQTADEEETDQDQA